MQLPLFSGTVGNACSAQRSLSDRGSASSSQLGDSWRAATTCPTTMMHGERDSPLVVATIVDTVVTHTRCCPLLASLMIATGRSSAVMPWMPFTSPVHSTSKWSERLANPWDTLENPWENPWDMAHSPHPPANTVMFHIEWSTVFT